MRRVLAVACLFGLVLVGLPVVSAQPDEDDDDDIAVSNDPSNSGTQLSQQLSDDGDDAGSASSEAEQMADQVDEQMAGPVAPEPVAQVKPAEKQPSPAKTKDASSAAGQHTVSLANSLDHFGQQHFAAAAPAKAEAKDTKKSDQKEAKASVDKASVDAKNAHIAADSAKKAAEVANKIAVHSVHMTENAKSALKDAHNALHKARVDSAGLSAGQKHDLKEAEAKLREATKSAEFGEVKNAKYVKAEVQNKKLQEMERKMAKMKKEQKKKQDNELEAMRKEIEELRQVLKKKEGDKAEDDALLQDLQDQIKEMEKADKKDDKETQKSHDEMKAEIERLKAEIKNMQDDEANVSYTIPKKDKKVEAPLPKEPEEEEEKDVEKYNVKMKPLNPDDEQDEEPRRVREATPVERKGIDIDTAMPYGDLEPFGREDTAQELTENSIAESDAMVDQLERAEVAEEKRSVFRALTRLRGAAITSFDGVARSQTGNIDEYNKIHQWRNTHPLHHLADEESDVSKWAFPENAD